MKDGDFDAIAWSGPVLGAPLALMLAEGGALVWSVVSDHPWSWPLLVGVGLVALPVGCLGAWAFGVCVLHRAEQEKQSATSKLGRGGWDEESP